MHILTIIGYIVAFLITLYLERHFTGETTIKNVIIAICLAPMGWWLLFGAFIIILDKNLNIKQLDRRLF